MLKCRRLKCNNKLRRMTHWTFRPGDSTSNLTTWKMPLNACMLTFPHATPSHTNVGHKMRLELSSDQMTFLELCRGAESWVPVLLLLLLLPPPDSTPTKWTVKFQIPSVSLSLLPVFIPIATVSVQLTPCIHIMSSDLSYRDPSVSSLSTWFMAENNYKTLLSFSPFVASIWPDSFLSQHETLLPPSILLFRWHLAAPKLTPFLKQRHQWLSFTRINSPGRLLSWQDGLSGSTLIQFYRTILLLCSPTGPWPSRAGRFLMTYCNCPNILQQRGPAQLGLVPRVLDLCVSKWIVKLITFLARRSSTSESTIKRRVRTGQK